MKKTMSLLSLCVLATLLVTSSGMSVRKTREVSTLVDASEYLKLFGYLEAGDFTEGDTQSGLIRFQETFNLPVTGTLNEETLEKMRQPRCQNKDTGMIASGRPRAGRWAVQGSSWPKHELTYKITQYTNDLPRNEIDVIVRESFRVWSDVTPLRFYRSDSDDADILILFVYGDHNDGGPFDGPGGTYAHAYYPQYGGDAHFDDDERWTIQTHEGVNFFQVCAHEFGHSLGLLHSGVENAIMEPYYQGYRPSWGLHQDDIDGIQSIYGSRENPRTTPPPTTSPTTSTTTLSTEGACSVDRWDAVVTVDGGDTFFFAGQYYYKLSTNPEEARTPRLIRDDWEGLPDNIDGATTLAQGLTFIFKGDNYYNFRGQRRFDDRVRKISQFLPNFPDNVDAAFVWPEKRTMHVAKGREYRNTRDESGVLTQTFPGAPAVVDAVNRFSDGKLYFFLGKLYYIFDKDHGTVVSGLLSVGQDFFGCHDNTVNLPGRVGGPEEGPENVP